MPSTCTSDSDCSDDSECLSSGYCRRRGSGARAFTITATTPTQSKAGTTYLYRIVPGIFTGDVRWLSILPRRRSLFQLNHQGAVNAEVALRWIKHNVPQPETIFIGGCSAGAWIDWLGTSCDARLPRFKGRAAGRLRRRIITESFLRDSFPIWSALKPCLSGLMRSIPTLLISTRWN